MQSALKIILSALLIYAISEFSKRSSFFGALVASLPLVSIVAMLWLWHDTHDAIRIAQFSTNVFWLVFPSLVLFLLLPSLLIRWHLTFPLALTISCAATIFAYFLTATVLKKLGIQI